MTTAILLDYYHLSLMKTMTDDSVLCVYQVYRDVPSFPVFIFWATIQISAACCYGDVLRLAHEHVCTNQGHFRVF